MKLGSVLSVINGLRVFFGIITVLFAYLMAMGEYAPDWF